jgi:hypothetical protein
MAESVRCNRAQAMTMWPNREVSAVQERLSPDVDAAATIESRPTVAAIGRGIDDDGMADGYHMLHETWLDEPAVGSGDDRSA